MYEFKIKEKMGGGVRKYSKTLCNSVRKPVSQTQKAAKLKEKVLNGIIKQNKIKQNNNKPKGRLFLTVKRCYQQIT